jgi:GNAT superfamily N-acetyltransferase
MKIEHHLANESSMPELLGMMGEFYLIDGYPFDIEKTRANLHTFLNTAQMGRIWTLWLDGKAVGYAILTFLFSFEHGGKMAFLDEFYVREPYRQLGIGQSTLRFLENEAYQMGIKRVQLELEKHNSLAKALYQRQGFADSGRYLFTKKIMGAPDEGAV